MCSRSVYLVHTSTPLLVAIVLLFPFLCSALAAIDPSVKLGTATAAATIATSRHRDKDAPIPITVLSGFLGAGKTNLLSHVLNNNQGLRIAVIVNDMASVNIDSKLVNRMTNAPAGMVELQNGCACCSKSEELLSSVADLVTLNDMRGDDESFDHIVVELSGVADPVSVRNKFQECAWYNMPLLERVRLDTMVTLIDCSTITDYIQSSKTANPDESPELFYRDGEVARPTEYDGISANLLAAMGIGMAQDSDSGVAELIVSQTEAADVVVLNKIDLVEDGSCSSSGNKLKEIQDLVRALNPRAKVLRTTYGTIPLDEVIGVARGLGVVQAGIIDDHKDAVHAVTCRDPTCTDPSHAHTHHHADHDDKDSAPANAAATGHAHSHSHDHNTTACDDPTCSDASHSHAHDHAAAATESTSSCNDPDCTDPSHSHSHDTTSQTHASIGSFVYRARRPFHPGRLVAFLKGLQIKRGLSDGEDTVTPHEQGRSFKVLRSKGFAWCANSDVAALYWSHAGISFDLSCLGSWWATLPRDQWPPEAVSAILQDYDTTDHDESDATFASVGDRRQEIVFIGPMLGDMSKQAKVSLLLDQCLLNDNEWLDYVSKRTTEGALANTFPSSIQARQVNY